MLVLVLVLVLLITRIPTIVCWLYEASRIQCWPPSHIELYGEQQRTQRGPESLRNLDRLRPELSSGQEKQG
ncbi:hypothetical protein V8C44DRAFT_333667 [Trichoderma aethiopicum]